MRDVVAIAALIALAVIASLVLCAAVGGMLLWCMAVVM